MKNSDFLPLITDRCNVYESSVGNSQIEKKKYDEIMIIKDKDLYSQGDLL
jgi:hypothetical protein